jgi:hypothetical protein
MFSNTQSVTTFYVMHQYILRIILSNLQISNACSLKNELCSVIIAILSTYAQWCMFVFRKSFFSLWDRHASANMFWTSLSVKRKFSEPPDTLRWTRIIFAWGTFLACNVSIRLVTPGSFDLWHRICFVMFWFGARLKDRYGEPERGGVNGSR